MPLIRRDYLVLYDCGPPLSKLVELVDLNLEVLFVLDCSVGNLDLGLKEVLGGL